MPATLLRNLLPNLIALFKAVFVGSSGNAAADLMAFRLASLLATLLYTLNALGIRPMGLMAIPPPKLDGIKPVRGAGQIKGGHSHAQG